MPATLVARDADREHRIAICGRHSRTDTELWMTTALPQ